MRRSALAGGLLLIFTAPILIAGCGESPDEPGAGPAGPSSCPGGQIVGPDGACMPVGIQGCVDMFMEEDNLCHPSITKCPPGTIPKFDEGCVAVGIPDCAPEFLEEDGLCHPTMAKCPAGTFAVPQDGCVPIDGPDGCGTGTWGNIPDEPGNVYVDPAYLGGNSDGSKAAPYTTIAVAMAAVQDGGRIALAEGVYDEPVKITKNIELAGKCASAVTISGAQPDSYGYPTILWIDSVDSASVRRVRASGPGIGVLVSNATAQLRNLHVTAATLFGVVAEGPSANVDMAGCFIEATNQDASTNALGQNVNVVGGASATFTGNAIVNGHAVGVLINPGAEVTAINNLVEGTLAQAIEPVGGYGFQVYGGAATLEANAIVANEGPGVIAAGNTAQVTATGNVVVGLESAVSGSSGMLFQDGARATISSSAFTGKQDTQLVTLDYGTEVTATTNLIMGAPILDSSVSGRGIEMQGGSATLESNTFFLTHDIGIFAAGHSSQPGTVLTAIFNVVEGTLPSPVNQEMGGPGVVIQENVQAYLESNFISSNRYVGLLVLSGAKLEIIESTIESTSPRESDGEFGIGMSCVDGSSMNMRASAVLRSHGVGIQIGSASATIEGTAVWDVENGAFTKADQSIKFTDIADCILAVDSAVDVSNVHVERCARSGMLFDASAGAVASSRFIGNRFGLVLQGSPQPTVSDSNSFERNTEQDRLSGGDLPVPDAPAPIP